MSHRVNMNSMAWLRNQRHQLINVLLGFIVVVGPLGLIDVVQQVLKGMLSFTSVVYIVTYIVVVILFVFRRIPDTWRALVFLLIVYGFALFSFLYGWLAGGGRLFLLTLVTLAAVLVHPRASLLAAGLSLVTYVVFGVGYSQGIFLLPDLPDPTTAQPIIAEGVGFILVIGMGVMGPWFFQQALQAATRANQDAQEARASLSERAEDLEAANVLLTKRAETLTTISDIAHNITSVLDTQVLLDQVVRMLRDAFDFYHVGIFLMGAEGAMVLRAASSEGGQRMLEQGYQVGLDAGEMLADSSQRLVARVATLGEHQIALDSGPDAVQFENPHLPETRSEIALPLRVRGETVGVLDVQCSKATAFGEQEVTALQVLAGLVGVAVGNAQLFQQVEAVAEAERRARGALAREAWQRVLQEQPDLGFLSDAAGTLPVGDIWDEEMRAAVLQGQPVAGSGAGDEEALAVPIRSRGQVVGVIDAHLPDDVGQWTPEQISLLEALSQQVGTALESAQLYRETQSRAVREQLTREITDKMRSTVSWGELLQTAIQEMASAIEAPRSFVQWIASDAALSSESALSDDSANGERAEGGGSDA